MASKACRRWQIRGNILCIETLLNSCFLFLSQHCARLNRRAIFDRRARYTMASHLPHPFDPLSGEEIQAATAIVRKAHGDELHFHVVSLQEPRKAEMLAWLADPAKAPRPRRVAEIVVIDPRNLKGHGQVYDGLVDLQSRNITKWIKASGQQPIVRSTSCPRCAEWNSNRSSM